MIKKLILFGLLNFLALALGGLFTNSGVPSEWYQNLNKAPWTPPGWVFGAAWTFIMLCFTIYMAYLMSEKIDRKKVIILFAVQWILNVIWNPVFFHFQATLLGFIVISSLSLLTFYFLLNYKNQLKIKSIFIAPYCLWLLIATSLNFYILIYN